jgi:hypothetical protein
LFTTHKEIDYTLQHVTGTGFRCAACEHDKGMGLCGTQMAKHFDAFVFSFLRHGTGVNKDNVSRIPQWNTFKASNLELGDESCAFCLIQTTPKYFECDCHELLK